MTRERKYLVIKAAALAAAVAVLSFFLKGFEYALLIILAAAIHEGGHLLAAKIMKVRLVKGEKHFLHLSYKFDFSSCSYFAEIAVSLAGAGFNVAAAFLTLAFLKRPVYPALFFIFSNLSLALFNLMPVSALDGAGALRALLSIIIGDVKAEKITGAVSMVFCGAFFVLSIYIQMRIGANFSLMVIALVMLCSCLKFGERSAF